MKIRIPARVVDHLLSSQAAYTPEADPEMGQVVYLIRKSRTRKDGSVHIEVNSPALLEALQVYVEAMEVGAKDNVGYADEGLDALADLNSARAVLRALAKG